MFGKKKVRRDQNRANERLVRKVLGKELGRRLFAFKCASDIQASLKMMSDQVHVPLFSLAEHALQLGAIQIAEANKDPEERENLRRHLTETHVGMRTIEKVARYDEEAAETLRAQRIRCFDIDRAARQLVVKFARFRPEDLEKLVVFGYQCRLAVAAGWPPPPEVAPRSASHRPPGTVRRQQRDDAQNTSVVGPKQVQ